MTDLCRRTVLRRASAAAAGLAGVVSVSGTAAAHYTGLPLYTTADLSVREGPGLNYDRIAVAEQYTGGFIVDGPVDNDGYRWWKIEYNGDDNNGRVTGWSVQEYTGHADFAYPCVGQVSQEFKSGHEALDVANDTGTPILAAREGSVDVTGYESGGCGYYIKLGHSAGYQTMYCHLSEIWVSEGESVDRHQQIGEMGDTGNSTGPHVHFTVEQYGTHKYVPGELYDEIDDKTGLAKNYDDIGSF